MDLWDFFNVTGNSLKWKCLKSTLKDLSWRTDPIDLSKFGGEPDDNNLKTAYLWFLSTNCGGVTGATLNHKKKISLELTYQKCVHVTLKNLIWRYSKKIVRIMLNPVLKNHASRKRLWKFQVSMYCYTIIFIKSHFWTI